MKRQESGFTLLEIMVVLVIIGVLAALVAPRFMDRADEAKVEATRVQIASIEQALKLYRLQNHRYPSSNEGLKALLQPDAKGRRYLDQLPTDAWGRDFLYLSPGVHKEVDVMSYGADGHPGGEGFDADIGNWR